MKFEDLLTQKRSKILRRWFDLVLETYPADTKRFLKKQKDQFANPVGYTISKELENLYSAFLQGETPEKVSSLLDGIIRIRAIQDFSPSQAVAFIFLLKQAIRDELKGAPLNSGISNALMNWESRIDDLALLAFDIYMKCREKIYEIRVNETRNQVSRLLRKAGLVSEIPEWDPDPKENKINHLHVIQNETR